MKLRILQQGDDQILQSKIDGGVWENVPRVDAASIQRDEADERLAQSIASKFGSVPSKVLEIIQAVRAAG